MLLFQLTRHGKGDWIDPQNYSKADAFKYRKQAVLAVLSWVQTVREWENVLQHMEVRGGRTSEDSRAHLLRFLNLGYDNMRDELLLLEMRLHIEPAVGRAIVANDSDDYRMLIPDARRLAVAQVEPLSTIDISGVA